MAQLEEKTQKIPDFVKNLVKRNMEESLKIHRFDELPSASKFCSLIESRNIPAVCSGCVKDSKAFSNWNPLTGGLDYLQERAGSCVVEAMLSRSAPVFYGDLRSHERVQLPFSVFLGFCKQHFQKTDATHSSFELERPSSAESDIEPGSFHFQDAPQQIYLAQVPIMNVENEENVQLQTLKEDIELPAFLETKTIASINLWMNNAQSRSSTHYDPYHNLLCIVSGCKRVVLWPPSASPLLYPMPIYGEASNHSSVTLENPDFSIHPRAECLEEYSQKVILHAGDALFIPEGWFHQVDSDPLTIAINFWWQSDIMSSMSEHMDSYHLRRILIRLIDKETNEVLPKSSADTRRSKTHAFEMPNDDRADDVDHENMRKEMNMLHLLEPLALQALHELVSLVHNGVNAADQTQEVHSTSKNDTETTVDRGHKKSVVANLYRVEDDPVARILWNLEPLVLQKVFLAMAQNFPRTLEALILYLLSPVGAKVLTQKFDDLAQQTTEEDRNEFFRIFYGVFDDQFAAMDAILNGKESFARQVFKNVIDKYIGSIC